MKHLYAHRPKIIFSIMLTLFFATLHAQTAYKFISSGVPDSAGTGFKTTSTAPIEANLIISNSIQQGYGPQVLYPETGTLSTSAVTFTIKGDGINTDTFDVVDMNILNFSETVELEPTTKILFKNASGNTISTWNTLAISTLTASTNYSIKDIFGQTSGVNGVEEITMTVDYKSTGNINNFEVRTLTLNNLMTLNVKDVDFKKQISLFPNPTTETINISVEPLSLTVYNISGQKLMTIHKKSFDVSSLKSGLYFLNIETNDGNFTKKFLKI